MLLPDTPAHAQAFYVPLRLSQKLCIVPAPFTYSARCSLTLLLRSGVLRAAQAQPKAVHRARVE